jgi:hypothetical protein
MIACTKNDCSRGMKKRKKKKKRIALMYTHTHNKQKEIQNDTKEKGNRYICKRVGSHLSDTVLIIDRKL